MAGAGGDPTTTVATAPTRITLVVTIGVIITTTATTINDDNGSGAYELRLLMMITVAEHTNSATV